MGLIKEPKNVDFSGKSEPWTESELIEFRKLMKEIKVKKTLPKFNSRAKRKKQVA